MATTKDILLDDDNVLRIENGDFVVGASDGQHAKLIMLSERGSWRRTPLAGLGARKLVNSNVTGLQALSVKKEVYEQFEADGMRVNTASVSAKGIISVDYDRV